MSSAIILNLTAIAVIVAGWTAAVTAFYLRLNDSPARPRTVHNHEVIELPGPGTQPEVVPADQRAA